MATKIIICGTRDFTNWELLQRKMDLFTFWMEDVEVVSGGQRKKIGYNQWAGADFFGEWWGQRNWYKCTIFHADWETHGKAAGPIRNEEMAKYVAENGGGHCVAFWDGSSTGTWHMIDTARRYGLQTRVVRYTE